VWTGTGEARERLQCCCRMGSEWLLVVFAQFVYSLEC
jgi:hypothetical protein